MKLYLAGPEVFLPDARAVLAKKQRLCAAYGFEGLSPTDSDVSAEQPEAARLIYRANCRMIRKADAIIANLSPFRGPSADPGTVFEIGFGIALGKPVFGYSSDARPLRERIHNGVFGPVRTAPMTGALVARDGLLVEDFGLPDNLMIAEAVRESGLPMVVANAAGKPLGELHGFEECLRNAAALLHVPPAKHALAR